MKIAVVGGGIFGCTAASVLSEEHDVHLFEKSDCILQAASWANQLRLHRGYHYPRSPETVRECQSGLKSFMEMYRPAVVTKGVQFYAIADEGSKTSVERYEEFCGEMGLAIAPVKTEQELVENASLFMVDEDRIVPTKLRPLVMRKLSDVTLHMDTAATWHLRVDYDRIVIATYAATNQVALELDAPIEPLRYEVVEKPVLEMPPRWKNTGVVVMDGPFCSLDPYGDTPYHVMGHVEHAIHSANEGLEPEVPEYLQHMVNRGASFISEHTKVGDMISAGSKFIPDLLKARHVGSMYVIRTVLPDRDDTDERPTMVDHLDDQVIRILSGKIPCAVDAARSVATSLSKSRGRVKSGEFEAHL